MTHQVLTLDLPDDAATAALGARIGEAARPGDVVALMGDLGAGKTTLARGLIRRLAGANTEAPSPTFTLVQSYAAPDFAIWHFDLYRLKDALEARELGMEEAVDGLAVIEWPERLGPPSAARTARSSAIFRRYRANRPACRPGRLENAH